MWQREGTVLYDQEALETPTVKPFWTTPLLDEETRCRVSGARHQHQHAAFIGKKRLYPKNTLDYMVAYPSVPTTEVGPWLSKRGWPSTDEL